MTSAPTVVAEREQLRDFWSVYDAHYDTVRQQLRTAVGDRRPELAALLEPALRDATRAERFRSLAGGALVDGDWGAFVAYLRERGREYANAGFAFSDWFAITNAMRQPLLPLLIDAYGEDRDRLAGAFHAMAEFFDFSIATLGSAYLDAKQALIEQQHDAIAELSIPVLRLREGLLLLPVVGVVDSTRARMITENLLDAIQHHRARAVVIDITGVPEVDTEVANRLLQTADAARLMGATAIVTGLSAGVAEALVTLGVNLAGLQTMSDLQSGVDAANQIVGYRVVQRAGRVGE